MSRVQRSTSTVVLASGASGTSNPVNCLGARRVHFSITCDVADQLTAGNVVARFGDGRTVTITPGTYPDGSADAATHELDAAGVIITLALNGSTHAETSLRVANGSVGPYNQGYITADYAHLALTKAASPGDATYTVIATVYYD